ncbi:uncharacterized membrane protein YhaH (DUF805 family) [Bradyrhizobium sp. OAE829]
MDYAWYLFRFEGRLNRARYWQALLISICWMIFLAIVTIGVVLLLGGSGPFNFSLGIEEILKLFDPASYRSLSWVNAPVLFFQAAGSVLLLWVFFATSVKRLHDRGRSGWWMATLVVFSGPFDQLTDWLPDVLGLLLAICILVLWVWGMIELFFLKGTTGTNAFGADPLAPVDTRPAWDQQSEIEMVPHKASPPPVWHVKPGYE